MSFVIKQILVSRNYRIRILIFALIFNSLLSDLIVTLQALFNFHFEVANVDPKYAALVSPVENTHTVIP